MKRIKFKDEDSWYGYLNNLEMIINRKIAASITCTDINKIEKVIDKFYSSNIYNQTRIISTQIDQEDGVLSSVIYANISMEVRKKCAKYKK